MRGKLHERSQDFGEGLYTIPLLQPGVYTIEVTADGFQTLKRERLPSPWARR